MNRIKQIEKAFFVIALISSFTTIKALEINLSTLESTLEQLATIIPLHVMPQKPTGQIIETKIKSITPKQNAALSKELEATRQPVNFFEAVMGITEKDFKDSIHQASFIDTWDKALVNTKTKEKYNYGLFSQIPLSTFQKQIKKTLSASKKSTFNIIEGSEDPTGSWFRDKVDVAALQANPTNNTAVFQIASNFNGLEAGGDPKAGVMIYLDPGFFVQGETAAISAAPGLIYRLYYYKRPVAQANFKEKTGQLKYQVNFLENLPQEFAIPIQNGYPYNIPLQQYSALNSQELSTIAGNVKIGFQDGIQVTNGLSKLKNQYPNAIGETDWAPVPTKPKQLISQVFSAAINIPNPDNQENYKNVARMLLQASYEGTLKSSYFYKKKKVFLTMIGGGVFNNKLSWIGEAIKNAMHDFIDNGDMEINLVIYNSAFYRNDADWKSFERDILDLVNKTGGTYRRYKKDGEYKVSLE